MIKKIVSLAVIFLFLLPLYRTESLEDKNKPLPYDNQFYKIKLERTKCDKKIIFENDLAKISVCYETFRSNLIAFIRRYRFSENKDLLDFIEKKITETNHVHIIDARWYSEDSDYSGKLNLKMKYRIADLLESGNVNVINKKNNKALKLISIKKHSSSSGTWRTFHFDDGTQFFSVTDIET